MSRKIFEPWDRCPLTGFATITRNCHGCEYFEGIKSEDRGHGLKQTAIVCSFDKRKRKRGSMVKRKINKIPMKTSELTSKERMILEMFSGAGKFRKSYALNVIAGKLGCSVQYVYTIKKGAIEKLLRQNLLEVGFYNRMKLSNKRALIKRVLEKEDNNRLDEESTIWIDKLKKKILDNPIVNIEQPEPEPKPEPKPEKTPEQKQNSLPLNEDVIEVFKDIDRVLIDIRRVLRRIAQDDNR